MENMFVSVEVHLGLRAERLAFVRGWMTPRSSKFLCAILALPAPYMTGHPLINLDDCRRKCNAVRSPMPPSRPALSMFV